MSRKAIYWRRNISGVIFRLIGFFLYAAESTGVIYGHVTAGGGPGLGQKGVARVRYITRGLFFSQSVLPTSCSTRSTLERINRLGDNNEWGFFNLMYVLVGSIGDICKTCAAETHPLPQPDEFIRAPGPNSGSSTTSASSAPRRPRHLPPHHQRSIPNSIPSPLQMVRNLPFNLVPNGSPALLISTQALSSNLIKLPSGLPYLYFVRTTTA